MTEIRQMLDTLLRIEVLLAEIKEMLATLTQAATGEFVRSADLRGKI